VECNMNLIELLEMRKFNIRAKIKLVRHQDSRFDVNKIYKNGMLNIYQSFQENNVFSNCEYIISFLGLENNKAKFVGIYKVLQKKSISEVRIPDNFIYPEMFSKDRFYYEMVEEPILNHLKERLVINW
jgi:hypothetical protein